jgi:hypothetical protein
MAPMSLAGILPHERFRNLEEQRFVCQCGACTSDVVARLD